MKIQNINFSKIGISLIIFLVVLVTIAVIKFGGGWGLSDKSLWEWMELLLIPIVLALGAWWVKHEERISAQRASLEMERRKILATYFDVMQELILNFNLAKNAKNEVYEIARARTLHTLSSLDGERKGHVLRFLIDAGILGNEHSMIRLSYADLSYADLTNIHLEGANLWCANLENANMKNAHLNRTNLPFAFMKGAILDNANLEAANLDRAVVSKEQLKKVKTLKEATMPEGNFYEDWKEAGEPGWIGPETITVWTSHDSR